MSEEILCPHCGSELLRFKSYDEADTSRYECRDCGTIFDVQYTIVEEGDHI